MRPDIELHIEELVLHGFAPGDRYRIAEAVEMELTRLLSEQGGPSWPAQGGEIPKIDAGSFNMASDAGPDQVGVQVAQTVYGGLSR